MKKGIVLCSWWWLVILATAIIGWVFFGTGIGMPEAQASPQMEKQVQPIKDQSPVWMPFMVFYLFCCIIYNIYS